MANHSATVSVYIIRIMLRAGMLAGVNADIARQAIHLEQTFLDNPDARIPIGSEELLWQFLADRSGDDYFGLHAALNLEPGEFDVMDFAIRTSTTLRQAFENAQRYNRLLHDVAEFELADDGKTGCLSHYFRDDPKGACIQAADFTLASAYAIGKVITEQPWVPVRVCFQHDQPADLSAYKTVFPCELAFNCTRNRLEFDSIILDYPVVDCDPALNAVLTRHADQLLIKLPECQHLIEQVRTQVAACLRHGEPSIEHVANGLHMTPRTLQRRLKESNTSYKQLLDTMRKALAERYLRESNFGVSEVAYLLGYSEPSAFHRAFRRWYGESPARFRQTTALTSPYE